jgi:hypothetical protein
MSRGWIVNVLRADSTLVSLLGTVDGVTGDKRIISAGAAGVPGSPGVEIAKPFVIIRAGDSSRALNGLDGSTNAETYLVWAHDRPGSYEAVIGPALLRIRALLDRREGINVSPTIRVTCCTWEGDSADLLDDGFGTATRYGSYRAIVRR